MSTSKTAGSGASTSKASPPLTTSSATRSSASSEVTLAAFIEQQIGRALAYLLSALIDKSEIESDGKRATVEHSLHAVLPKLPTPDVWIAANDLLDPTVAPASAGAEMESISEGGGE